MHTKRIKVQKFFNYEDFELVFPDTGITLVTGKNGSGKSAISTESISVGWWGETLRRTPPWRMDTAGAVEVESTNLLVKRGKSPKSSPTLGWASDGVDQQYATPTKAQGALEDVIGDWDTWKRVSVLAPMIQDIALFTLSTDAVRKRLIESLIGLDIFDPALDACRKDKRKLEKEKIQIESTISNLEGKLEGYRKRLDDAKNGPVEEYVDYSNDLAALISKRKKLRENIAEYDRDIEDIKKDVNTVNVKIALNRRHKEDRQKKISLVEKEACPLCEREFDADMRATVLDEVDKANKLVAEEEKVLIVEVNKLNDSLDGLLEDKNDLMEDNDKLTDKISTTNAEITRNNQIKRRLTAKKEKIADIEKEIADLEDEFDNEKTGLEELSTRVALQQAGEKVLGLEGARAGIIGKLLGGIESMVNRRLLEIAGDGLKVELRDYTETEKSGITSKISLDVIGAGGGYGYRAASPGERRRIDVAFLFALADIAAAARGVKQGDIYVDEITDGVDVDGKMAIAEVLKDIAKSRHVVVITHDLEFAGMLQYTQHLHVTKNSDDSASVEMR